MPKPKGEEEIPDPTPESPLANEPDARPDPDPRTKPGRTDDVRE